MSVTRPRYRVYLALSVLALAGLVFGAEALAQKKTPPPPPPPAPGLIYFSGWVTTSGNTSYATPMSMNGDGTNKRNAFSTSSPSYQRHSNSRWFLLGDYDYNGPVDQWGIPMAYELYAVNEQNQWVQLTGDPNIHWSGVTGVGSVAWGKDDSFVSYTAWWFTGNGNEVRGGLFYVDIDWSTGEPVAGPPTFLFETDAIWFQDWEATVNIDGHDWSPDGTEVIFTKEDGATPGGTFIADFSGVDVQYHLLNDGLGGLWSPDGSRIAFSDGAVWTIKPDGTGAVRLTTHSISKTEERTQGSPSWSPDGAYLAYTEAVTTSRKTTRSVLRIPSAGGTPINLTSEFTNAAGPLWRP